MRILISGTCLPELNSNYELIEDITVGFKKQESHEVQLIKVNQLPKVINAWKPHLTLLVGGLALETIPLFQIDYICNLAGSKLAFWSLEDPYELDWVLQKGTVFDLICTTDYSSYCFYPGEWNVKHLPLASPDFQRPQSGKQLQPSERWLFCGVQFQNRKDWIDGIRHTHPNGLLIGPKWPSYGQPTKVSNRRISRKVLHTLYRTMPITLSIGRDHNLANSAKVIPSTPGPRLFEAAGCGAAQLFCGNNLEMSCYYEPDHELLWGRSVDEACECMQRASKDPQMVEQIRRRAWNRTQAEHLYSHRAKKILKWIGEL